MALSHTNCVHCGVKLRHWRDPKTPDTKAHAGKGACTVCAYQRSSDRGLRTGEPKASEAELMMQRTRFEAGRRARGIPVGGVGFTTRKRGFQ